MGSFNEKKPVAESIPAFESAQQPNSTPPNVAELTDEEYVARERARKARVADNKAADDINLQHEKTHSKIRKENVTSVLYCWGLPIISVISLIAFVTVHFLVWYNFRHPSFIPTEIEAKLELFICAGWGMLFAKLSDFITDKLK